MKEVTGLLVMDVDGTLIQQEAYSGNRTIWEACFNGLLPKR